MADRVYTDPATGDVILEPEAQAEFEAPMAEDNLAMQLDDSTLALIGTTLTEELAHDARGRSDWENIAKRYMEALGLGPESAPDDMQADFSDTSDHPLLLKALTNFQAKALSAVLPSPDRVVTVEPDIDVQHIKDPAERKAARAKLQAAVDRVQDFYTHYLLNELPSYVEDFDMILNDCGLHGAGFRRIGVDTSYVRTPVRPVKVAPEDLILSYDATNFRGTGRVSHRYRETTSDLVRGMRSGAYRAVDLTTGGVLDRSIVTDQRDIMFGTAEASLHSPSHVMYDVFAHLFMPNDLHPDMIARPYIVTIHANTQTVLSIRRNWDPTDPDETPLEHFAAYIYSPGRSAISAVGLGALLANITLALRTAQRRALDAAYLANHPSGFIASGMSIRDDSTPFVAGELRPVDVASGDIRQSILINPFQGPDAGLLQLYDRMNESGKELGNLASIDFASMMKSGIAAGPALAAYDESTEFQTSVHRRLYRGHQTELNIIHARMRETLGGRQVSYGAGKFLLPDDLATVRVKPAMKPGFVSRQRAMIEAQAVLDLSNTAGNIINKREAVERYLQTMGITDADALLMPDPASAQVPATDPVNEYIRLMAGQPLKAAPTQNHRAHITAHTAQLAGIQQSQLPVETGQIAAAALAAHIAEHEALDMAVQVSAATGIPLATLIEGIPPEMEAQIAPMIAQAVQAVERQRAAPSESDTRLQIEQMRSQTRIMVEELKAQQADLDRRADQQIAELREAAQTYRNDMDNQVAMLIAQVKNSTPPTTNPRPGAGSSAPTNNPTP